MEREFHEGRVFENIVFTKMRTAGSYENCTFLGCDFSNADLSDVIFLECEFQACNLSLAKLTNTSFNDARFTDCKLLGLHFEDCNKMILTMLFENCNISLCSFNKLKIKKSSFRNSKIVEVDFSETDLSNSEFINCDLLRTVFHHTNLEFVDFSTSGNFSIDPDQNRIKKARFSVPGLPGLLGKYDIIIE